MLCFLVVSVAIIAAYLRGRVTGAALERRKLAMEAVQDDVGAYRRR